MLNTRCPGCGTFAFLETLKCAECGTEMGFHYPSLTMRRALPEGLEIDGEHWLPCVNRDWNCNWLARAEDGHSRCFADRIVLRRPPAEDTVGLEQTAKTAVSMRRLIAQCLDLGLPVEPHFERPGGLGFNLLSRKGSGEPVRIGHANGVITINVDEESDADREAIRFRLGEAYRSVLGHFRHEIGHYYQWILVPEGPLLDECRALFGDERESYRDAISHHYTFGAREDWQESFISPYATMHPWEDFAETFAHYLHITATLSTTAAAGLVIHDELVGGAVGRDIRPSFDYSELGVERLIDDWRWLSLLFNRVNRTMGMGDLYPFELNAPAQAKLAFVHRIVVDAGRDVRAARSGAPASSSW